MFVRLLVSPLRSVVSLLSIFFVGMLHCIAGVLSRHILLNCICCHVSSHPCLPIFLLTTLAITLVVALVILVVALVCVLVVALVGALIIILVVALIVLIIFLLDEAVSSYSTTILMRMMRIHFCFCGFHRIVVIVLLVILLFLVGLCLDPLVI